VRLKLDEQLGRHWAEQLRSAGHDVHTIWDEDLSGASDAEVLAAASAEDRVLITMDLDFANPMRFPPEKAGGIVVLRARVPTGRAEIDQLTGALVDALQVASPAGQLWVVDRDRVRRYETSSD
jgi:predicted nuclease of predicted toxin-antitoxin system